MFHVSLCRQYHQCKLGRNARCTLLGFRAVHVSAPTWLSNWEQRLCSCSRCVPIDIEWTACTGIHRTVYPHLGKHNTHMGVRCGRPLQMRPKAPVCLIFLRPHPFIYNVPKILEHSSPFPGKYTHCTLFNKAKNGMQGALTLGNHHSFLGYLPFGGYGLLHTLAICVMLIFTCQWQFFMASFVLALRNFN